MRVLFRDQSDDTLFLADIRDSYYDPIDQWLYFDTADEDEIIIPNISRVDADHILRTIFAENKMDLSAYPAYLNIEPPTMPEADTCCSAEDSSNGVMKRLFKRSHKNDDLR